MKLVRQRMKYNPVDLAYAAALIDGEGCIGIHRNRDPRLRDRYRYRMSVQIGMADKEPIQFMYRTFGGSYHTYEACLKNGRLRHNWQIGATKAMLFLEAVLPYLKGKTKQAELAIEFQKHRHFRPKIGPDDLEIDASYFREVKELKYICLN